MVYRELPNGHKFIVMAWEDFGHKLRAGYILKIFQVHYLSEKEIDVTLIQDMILNTRIVQIEIEEIWDDEDAYYIVVLTDTQSFMDASVFLLHIIWQDFDCRYRTFFSITGKDFEIDSFYARSFAFIPNEPIFVISVDNYGLVAYNLYTMKITEVVLFRSIDYRFPEDFEVTRVIPLTSKSLRVFIKDIGSVSMTWSRIELSQDFQVFRRIQFRDYTFDFKDRITTNLIATTTMGYAQIIYQQESRSALTAYVRIFNEFNKFGTKILNEFSIGRVPHWSTIGTRTLQDNRMIRVIVIWGSMLYIYDVDLYPGLTINSVQGLNLPQSQGLNTIRLPTANAGFNITARNFASGQTIFASIQVEQTPPVSRNILMALCFALGVALLSLVVYKVAGLWLLTKEMKKVEKPTNQDGSVSPLLSKKPQSKSSKSRVDEYDSVGNVRKVFITIVPLSNLTHPHS